MKQWVRNAHGDQDVSCSWEEDWGRDDSRGDQKIGPIMASLDYHQASGF